MVTYFHAVFDKAVKGELGWFNSLPGKQSSNSAAEIELVKSEVKLHKSMKEIMGILRFHMLKIDCPSSSNIFCDAIRRVSYA